MPTRMRRRAWRHAAVLCAALLALAAGGAPARGQELSGRPGTLAGIVAAHAKALGNALQDAGRVVPVPDPAQYRVLVVYRGQRRPTAPDARRLMAAWGESVGVPERVLAVYAQEIAVQEAGQPYWLPVQARLLPFLDTELAPGDAVYLRVAFIGVGGGRPLFLVNEFEKARLN
jgi:hypothetical protein